MERLELTSAAVLERQPTRVVEQDSEVRGLYDALPDRAKEDYLLALKHVTEESGSEILLSYT